jgi:hypothetical protein
MKTIEEIGAQVLKEHIIKNWMTHDAMWFYHCLQSHGISEANRLNKSAIKSLAAIELKRAEELFGIDTKHINTFEDIRKAIDAVFRVSKGDFMKFTYSFPEENVLRWEWGEGQSCFAYQGMKRMGAIAGYQCGVLYRVLCWLENLGAAYSVSGGLDGCLMHTSGKCVGEIRFFFP